MNAIKRASYGLLISLASSGLFIVIYVWIGTNGDVWTEKALTFGVFGSVIICVSALFIAVISRSVKQVILSSLIFLMWLVVVFLGPLGCALEALSGGYERISNCGQDDAISIGLFAFLFIVLTQWRMIPLIVIASGLIATIMYGTTNWYMMKPLKLEIAKLDHATNCLILGPKIYRSDGKLGLAKHVISIEDLNLGIVIGEQSPRIYLISRDEVQIWSYSQRKFMSLDNGEGLIELCTHLNV